MLFRSVAPRFRTLSGGLPEFGPLRPWRTKSCQSPRVCHGPTSESGGIRSRETGLSYSGPTRAKCRKLAGLPAKNAEGFSNAVPRSTPHDRSRKSPSERSRRDAGFDADAPASAKTILEFRGIAARNWTGNQASASSFRACLQGQPCTPIL